MILARATFRNILISSQKRGLGLASPSPVDRVEPRELRRAWTRLCLFGQADPSDGLANWQPVYLLHQSGAIAGLVRPAWRATRGRIRWHAIIALVRGDILHLDPPACYYYPSPPIGIRPRLLSNRDLPPDPCAGRRIFAAVLIRALQDVFVPDQTATLEDRLDALTFLADPQVQQSTFDIYGHNLAAIFKESPMPDRLRANTMYAEAHS
jgi:hypothetical protein